MLRLSELKELRREILEINENEFMRSEIKEIRLNEILNRLLESKNERGMAKVSLPGFGVQKARVNLRISSTSSFGVPSEVLPGYFR